MYGLSVEGMMRGGPSLSLPPLQFGESYMTSAYLETRVRDESSTQTCRTEYYNRSRMYIHSQDYAADVSGNDRAMKPSVT